MLTLMLTLMLTCIRCTRYRDMMSPEDIIPVFEGVFVGSSDERRKHAMNAVGAEAAPWGELFAIWNVDTAGQVRCFVGFSVGRSDGGLSSLEFSNYWYSINISILIVRRQVSS